MQEIIINDELVLCVPDGFHVMTEEERSGLQMLNGGEWIGLSDPDRHIKVSVGWKKINGFSALLLSGKDLAKNSEKSVSGPMSAYGYRLEGFLETVIAGEKAAGFRYRYDAQQIAMAAELDALKIGKSVYYFNLYSRGEHRKESAAVWQDLLGMIRKK